MLPSVSRPKGVFYKMIIRNIPKCIIFAIEKIIVK